MPEYEFQDQDGGYETLFMDASDAVPIGQMIEHEGRLLTRLVSRPGLAIGFKPFVSRSLERNHPHASTFDSKGRPSFQNEKEMKEFVARNNADPKRDKIVWDK